jgi:hypothetical protein
MNLAIINMSGIIFLLAITILWVFGYLNRMIFDITLIGLLIFPVVTFFYFRRKQKDEEETNEY